MNGDQVSGEMETVIMYSNALSNYSPREEAEMYDRLSTDLAIRSE
jgi:hypothetical protein